MSSELGKSGFTKNEHILTALYLSTIASFVICIFLSGHRTLAVWPEFTVEMASVHNLRFEPVSSPLNVTLGYTITGEWKLDFNVRNPNKDYVLSYSDMNVAVEYPWLAWVKWDGYKIPGFNQTGRTNSVHATPSGKPRFPFVEDAHLVGDFSKNLANPGFRSEGFKVELKGMVAQRKAGGGEVEEATEEKWRELKVGCEYLKDVAFEVTAAGVMGVAATPSGCRTLVD